MSDSRRDLADLSLCEAASAIRAGRISAEQLMMRYVERIRLYEPRIHAWAFHNADRALEEARKADRALRAGESLGPLHGVAVAFKDIIYTKGIPTRMGSPIFGDFVPEYSAACVERLEQAGAIVHGKTVTTEFANVHPGPTTNPWNIEFTPGGSSSGSAAAVAARFTGAALGSQTRGSIIRPAVFCGVVGYKPSFGAISRFGMYPQSWTLDHVGIISRSVDDAALLAACLVGHDARDRGSVRETTLLQKVAELDDLAAPPRLASVRSPLWSTASQPQQRLFEANCRALRQRGAHMEDVDLPDAFNASNEVCRLIQLAEMAHSYREHVAGSLSRLSAGLRALCERGARYTAMEYMAALELRERLRRELASFFARFDAIVTPPAAGEAPRTLASTGDAAFCALWSLCGVPSVAFPTGIGPNGLPMGLQVVGPYLEDRRALQVAKWCQQNLPFEVRPPV